MPNFVMIQGKLGAGKTMLASVLAQYWRIRSGNEAKLFSNYDMMDSRVFDSADVWTEVAEAHGSAIIWDEAQTQFDRRNWQRNTFMTQIFNYARKMRTIHVFVNPVGSNLDGRILDFIEIFFHVQKFPGRGIKIDVYEYQDQRYGPWGRYIKSLFIPWAKVKAIWRLNIYDTDSILYPFPVPKTEREQIQLLERIVDVQAKVTLEERRERKTLGGWINPSDHQAFKQGDYSGGTDDDERPEEYRLFVPEFTSFGGATEDD